jgi:hypothetical protein
VNQTKEKYLHKGLEVWTTEEGNDWPGCVDISTHISWNEMKERERERDKKEKEEEEEDRRKSNEN